MTLLLHFGILFAMIAGLRCIGRKTDAVPLMQGLGIVILYWMASPVGFWAQSWLPLLSSLHWNWLGKLFAIIVAFGYWRLSGLSNGGIGMTLRWRSGSILSAAAVIALICIFSWGDEMLAADGKDLSGERLLFQALMPGLDEELIFRGLLLAFFTRAFGVGREVAGGAFGWAGIAVTFLFAAGHGLFVAGGTLVVNWHALVVTGVIGAGLLWLRTRTGSLAAPLLAHNLSNFGNSFF